MPPEPAKTAVFLVNLGGPRDLAEVRPYLRELFSDPHILGLPAALRLPLAFAISVARAPSSRAKYRKIGGGSPLVAATEAQAGALAARLGPGFSCHVAMRCGHPAIREAVEDALAAGAGRAVALTLYPQFSDATTGSSFEEIARCWPRELPLSRVLRFGAEPRYVAAAASGVREALSRLPAGVVRHVVFSAHGLPRRVIEQGDPYEQEVQASARAIAGAAGLAPDEWTLAYQSRVRPGRWLGPDMVETVSARARGRALVLVPLTFVSEHLETLYDLDVLGRGAAERAGAAVFVRARTPGERPEFIEALAAYVREAVEAGADPAGEPTRGREGKGLARGGEGS